MTPGGERQRLAAWAEQALADDGWTVAGTPDGLTARREGVEVEVDWDAVEYFESGDDAAGLLFVVRSHARGETGPTARRRRRHAEAVADEDTRPDG